jgi:hypothetical protein
MLENMCRQLGTSGLKGDFMKSERMQRERERQVSVMSDPALSLWKMVAEGTDCLPAATAHYRTGGWVFGPRVCRSCQDVARFLLFEAFPPCRLPVGQDK